MSDLNHLNFCMVVTSSARTAGLALAFGPFLNSSIGGLDFELRMFGLVAPVNVNNRDGLIPAFLEFITMLLTWFFVQDPPPREEDDPGAAPKPGSSVKGDHTWEMG